ncbi:hypothetical protein J2754_001080 [Halarchaeum solikamskense]|uniref:hypothetical protein n=1 Tax=Halarchaeum nitratireducens TaxID=489913 RepID=UPI001B3AD7D8|nr:hypothetical protein [Halarchaeum solikamskense]MBP2250763.1 hypothetical protein [Halarchaeum solikamskense]
MALAATSPVAAANATANNSTASTNATSANETVVSGGPVPVDGVTTITGWSYQDGTMRVTLEASQYHVITLSGSAQRSGRVAHSAFRRVILQGGETRTVTVPADRVDGRASVGATTSACIASGSCPAVYSREDSSMSLLPGRPSGSDWIVTFFAAGFAALLGAAVAGFGYKRYVGGRRRVF